MLKLLSGYEIELSRQGLRQTTIALHVRCIRKVISDAPQLSPEQVETFFQKLLRSNKKASYVNFFVYALRSFGRYLNNGKLANLKPFREERPNISTMSDEEIEAFLKLPPPEYTFVHKNGKSVHRVFAKGYAAWTLYFSIFAYTGMRPNEIARLTTDDVNFGNNTIIVRSEISKTKKGRWVPIPPQIHETLFQYVRNVKQQYLFPSLRNGKHKGPVVDNVDWHYNFHARIKRLGIKRSNVKPYSLRHSFITRLLDEDDVNIFNVQKIVGHSRLDTTARYYHYTTKAIQKTIRKDPLARLAITIQEKTRRMADAIRAFQLEMDPRFDFVIEENGTEIKFSAKAKNIPDQ